MSVREPDAWMHVFGGLSLGVFKTVDPRLQHLCVPLYRHPQPTLTDEEREAVEAAVDFCESTDKPLPRSEQIATLRKLLERLHT